MLLRPLARGTARALPQCLACARTGLANHSSSSKNSSPAARRPAAAAGRSGGGSGGAAKQASAAAARGWTWSSNAPRKAGGSNDIEVKPKVPLTVEEVVEALEKNGGADLRVVYLAGKSDLAEAMIFCTGKSMRHMQRVKRLSDVLTYALKRRRLRHAPGVTGAEGYDCDDWMIVDCWNLIVHVMEAGHRRKLKLEERWENMKPYDPKDWEGRDSDADDSSSSSDEDSDSDATNGADDSYGWADDASPLGRAPRNAAEEAREAERIATLWKAHVTGVSALAREGLRRRAAVAAGEEEEEQENVEVGGFEVGGVEVEAEEVSAAARGGGGARRGTAAGEEENVEVGDDEAEVEMEEEEGEAGGEGAARRGGGATAPGRRGRRQRRRGGR